MKKFFCLPFALAFTCLVQAQTTDDYSAIKLFVEPDSVAGRNAGLSGQLKQRLYTKIIQLINQTGIAEIGYSNFWVLPTFNVLSTSVDNAGLAKVYLSECELFVSISRREYGKNGAATYASFSKSIMGSGTSKDESILNAMNSISSNDKEIVAFLTSSKMKINEYFKAHCTDVAKEAEHAYNLNDYGRSIALYFSIPSNASCFPAARDASIKVYRKFLEDQCSKSLIQLKALIATIQTKDASSMDAYNNALGIIGRLNPSSTDCYAEAKLEIEKIEKRFTESQKNQWEMEKKRASDRTEVQKEMYKAMAKINSNYQPSGNITIVK